MNHDAFPSHSALGKEASLSCSLAFIGPPAQPGQVGTLEGWELVSLIGEGGMGLVFLGRAPHTGQEAAIKVLRPEFGQSERAKAYFLKEANHMRQLNHPHILPVMEFKEFEGSAYLVMPYMRQRSLKQLLNHGPLKEESLLIKLLLQVAGALLYAHQHGIIHRDVKPSNILLDDEFDAKLTDFGLSRSLFNDVLTDVRQTAWEGTAAYFSPQAAQGEQDDTRGDIYALGAVLYELLAGQPPYAGTSREDIIQRILAGPPTPISDLNPQASPGLIQIAEKAMARELRDRYAHFSYFVEDLERVQKGQLLVHAGTASPLSSGLDKQFPTIRIAVGMVVVALLLAICWFGLRNAPWASKDPRLHLIRSIQLPGVWDWAGASVSQYNDQGSPAIFLPYDKQLLIVSGQGQLMGQWTMDDPQGSLLTLRLRTNVNPDATLETVLSYRSVSNVVISVLNDHPIEINRITLPASTAITPTGVKGDSDITQAAWIDLADDHQPFLLALVNTGFQLKPRGLFCFDLRSSKLVWQHPTGPHLVGLEWLDLNHDGRQELICGSQAAANGNQAADGTSDEFSYLFAFDARGESLWTRKLGDIYTVVHPLVADLRGDGQREILAWLESYADLRTRRGLPVLGQIWRFNAQGETIAVYDTGGVALCSCRTADIDGDTHQEVLATDQQGRLHVLDADLKLKKIVSLVTRQYESVRLRLWAVADLDGDHKPELIFHSAQEEFVSGTNPGNPLEKRPERFYHQVELLVLNQELKIIDRYPLTDKCEAYPAHSLAVADMDGDGQNEIVYLADKAQILKFKTP